MNSYPYFCILPYSRSLIVENHQLRPLVLDDHQDIENKIPQESRSFEVYVSNSTIPRVLNSLEIGELVGFTYSPLIIFFHERELRDIILNSPSDESFLVTHNLELESKIISGYINPNIVIKHIGVVELDDLGFGAFAKSDIDQDSFLGEYTGIVTNTSTLTENQSYCCQYPSCDGGISINGLEYGNIMRFINHSKFPNASFKSYNIQGIPHVLCVSNRKILTGEQIFVNYGASYWQNKNYKELDI